MRKRKGLSMGWFGWTLTSVVAVTLIGSSLFFFNILDLNSFSAAGGNDDKGTEKDDISQETVEKVEEVRDTVGKENEDIGAFISESHDFYNETTGYGGISSLDWERQQEKATKIAETAEEKLASVEDEALKKDLEHIQELAKAAANEKETGHVRELHRMFHDLDVALNDYNAYDKIWNVTETLQTTN